MPNFSLVPHPETLPNKVSGVSVDLRQVGNHLFMAYGLDGAENVVLPLNGEFERRDGLWQSTCFELFVQKWRQDGYFEFNFAPLSRWAAYGFDKYRKGMRPLNLTNDPHLVDSRIDDRGRHFPRLYQLDVLLSLSDLPSPQMRIGLSAVIEEKDGTKSYWALRHPPGKPDFHHRDCFALQLPAATAS